MMGKSKEQMLVSARVSSDLHHEVVQKATALDMSQSTFVEQAVLEKLDRAHIDKRQQLLSEENAEIAAERNSACRERDDLKEELKQIATKLGVRETAILPRIAELYDKKRLASEKIEVITSERDSFEAERDAVRIGRNAVEANFEKVVADLQNAEARLAAYAKQGLMARIFKWKPIPIPFATPETERLWETPASPITPTPTKPEPVETE